MRSGHGTSTDRQASLGTQLKPEMFVYILMLFLSRERERERERPDGY